MAKMGKFKMNHCFLLVISILSYTLISCVEDEISDKKDENSKFSRELSFKIGSSDAWSAISTTRTNNKLLDHKSIEYKDKIGGYQFILQMSEFDGIAPQEVADSVTTTRATIPIPADDELDLGVYAYMTPKNDISSTLEYDETKSKEYMINQMVDISEQYAYSPVKYWPGSDYWLNFFAYRPFIDNVNVEGNTYLVLDASENTPKILKYIVPQNIEHQVDLLTTSTETLAGDYKETVDLQFAHILSAVKFKVGSIPAVEITEIALNKVAAEGANINMKRDATWESISGKENFTQKLTGFTTEKNSGSQIGKTFYMLPQTFDDGSAQLSITIRFGSEGNFRDYLLTVPLKDFCKEWEQGKTYVYTLSTPDEVKMEIEEEFTQYDNVKSNVYFENIGCANMKIRAAIVGYWIIKREINGIEQDCVIAAWDPDNDGTFVKFPGEGWSHNTTDGFYYYEPTLSRGDKTNNLFDSYTLKTNPPVVGAELVLTIVGQACIDGYDGPSWTVPVLASN